MDLKEMEGKIIGDLSDEQLDYLKTNEIPLILYNPDYMPLREAPYGLGYVTGWDRLMKSHKLFLLFFMNFYDFPEGVEDREYSNVGLTITFELTEDERGEIADGKLRAPERDEIPPHAAHN